MRPSSGRWERLQGTIASPHFSVNRQFRGTMETAAGDGARGKSCPASARHLPTSVRLSAADALAVGRPAGDVDRLRIGAATVAGCGARLDKAEYALGSTPRALLTRIERPNLRAPRRLAVVVGQRRADRAAKDAAERRRRSESWAQGYRLAQARRLTLRRRPESSSR